MMRTFVAPVALAALAVLLAVGACNRQGPTTTTPNINTALLMESLGTASAIPLQQCSQDVPSQPLIMASAGAGDDVQVHPLSAVVRPLPAPQMVSQAAACIPPFAQQDNAVPLTRVKAPVNF